MNASQVWFRLASVYFAVDVWMGVVMGGSGDHTLLPVHAHINLLGWVSMALFGLIAAVRPDLVAGRAARVHFWAYNLGVPVMLLALALRIKGVTAVEPVIGAGSVVVGLSVLIYCAMLLKGARARGIAQASTLAATSR